MSEFVAKQKRRVKSVIRGVATPIGNFAAQMRARTSRPPRFTGAYQSYDEAISDIRKSSLTGYDNDEIVDVSLEAMVQIFSWDYPVLFWLDRLKRPGTNILDAGGHVGTKFVAFRNLLDLRQIKWTVYDLPALVRAGNKMLASDPSLNALHFTSDLGEVEHVDILLASGLMQYLDKSFMQFIADMPNRPDNIIINKVATRDGETVTTLEQIGNAQVAYQIRNRQELEQGFLREGYEIIDSWIIPELAHRIATHRHFGMSVSRGYVLERKLERK